jgi:hypothetical protein
MLFKGEILKREIFTVCEVDVEVDPFWLRLFPAVVKRQRKDTRVVMLRNPENPGEK